MYFSPLSLTKTYNKLTRVFAPKIRAGIYIIQITCMLLVCGQVGFPGATPGPACELGRLVGPLNDSGPLPGGDLELSNEPCTPERDENRG